MMKCECCGFEENDKEKFVGIFVLGSFLKTTDGNTCCLYGCPKCGTVKFTTNVEYIIKRKQEWKDSKDKRSMHNIKTRRMTRP